jgi:hypothetical protein
VNYRRKTGLVLFVIGSVSAYFFVTLGLRAVWCWAMGVKISDLPANPLLADLADGAFFLLPIWLALAALSLFIGLGHPPDVTVEVRRFSFWTAVMMFAVCLAPIPIARALEQFRN